LGSGLEHDVYMIGTSSELVGGGLSHPTLCLKKNDTDVAHF